MRIPRPLYALSVFCLLSAVPLSQAQNQLSLGELQSGQLALNLSLTEQRQVAQDTLNASLQYVAQGRDRRALQDEVNRKMAEALALLEGKPDIEFTTGSYHVYIVQTGRPASADVETPVYRAQQSVEAHSSDSTLLLELSGQLQEAGLTLNGLHYSLSREVHTKVQSELLQEVLQNLQGRAQQAADALGKGKAELVEVSMDGSPFAASPRMYARASMMSVAEADMAPPVAEPGETTVSVSISARAVISP